MTFTDGLKQEMIDALRAHCYVTNIDEYGTIFINSSVFEVWISARPSYCDRGRWQLNCESRDPRIATVDYADGFPRYYFNTECLVQELTSWFEARQRHIKDRPVFMPLIMDPTESAIDKI